MATASTIALRYFGFMELLELPDYSLCGVGDAAKSSSRSQNRYDRGSLAADVHRWSFPRSGSSDSPKCDEAPRQLLHRENHRPRCVRLVSVGAGKGGRQTSRGGDV